MIKKISLFITISLIIPALIVSCSKSGKYAEVIKVIDQAVVIFNQCSDSLLNVRDGKETAAVIDKFTSDISKIIPQIKEIEKKYGIQSNPDQIPDELKESNKKMQDASRRMEKAVRENADKFMKTPEVLESVNRLRTAIYGEQGIKK